MTAVDWWTTSEITLVFYRPMHGNGLDSDAQMEFLDHVVSEHIY